MFTARFELDFDVLKRKLLIRKDSKVFFPWKKTHRKRGERYLNELQCFIENFSLEINLLGKRVDSVKLKKKWFWKSQEHRSDHSTNRKNRQPQNCSFSQLGSSYKVSRKLTEPQSRYFTWDSAAEENWFHLIKSYQTFILEGCCEINVWLWSS